MVRREIKIANSYFDSEKTDIEYTCNVSFFLFLFFFSFSIYDQNREDLKTTPPPKNKQKTKQRKQQKTKNKKKKNKKKKTICIVPSPCLDHNAGNAHTQLRNERLCPPIDIQCSPERQEENIRIFNGCEVLIENSVTRVTVRHHKACRVMPNSYSE